MPAPTEEQELALRTRDVSIALDAGAGCGKTFVLTERFLSHLDPEPLEDLKPADLHQLIAITFTDAAAREMRSRIREKCRERLQSAPAEKQDDWLRLLRAIEAARVSTIHAFCASLLRTDAVAAGLDPLFGVLDQSGADVLESEVIDDVLREKFVDQNEETMELAAEYSLSRVKEQIAALLPHRHSAAFTKWLAATPEEVVAAWSESYVRDVFPNAVRQLAALPAIDEIIGLLNSSRSSKPTFSEARDVLLDRLSKLKSGNITREELQDICAHARIKGSDGKYICTVKDWGNDKAISAAYTKACESLRKTIGDLPPELEASAALTAAQLGIALLRLTNDVIERYEQRKAAQNALDFDDLLAHAHRLLTDPKHAAIQQHLSSELRLVLVDEFQDTDQLQVELVKALCGEGFAAGRLFFVGDMKQSIYRFRGARPDVFLDLRAQVEKRGQLPLSKNFRSQPAILHFVNALFHDAFDNYQSLQANRAQVTSEPAVEFLWNVAPDKNKKNVKGAALAARREEARRIARRLRVLVDSDTERPIVDEETGQPRSVRLGDVAILFRALSDVQVYEQSLREYGLDYYLVGGHAFYAQQEIYDVLNLLRAVASPADEISLAGALRSPFFSLADETLFWLVEAGGREQGAGGKGGLNAGLFAAPLPMELSPEERAKTAAAAETIRYLRARKDRVAIAELMGDALARTGYDATILAEFMGERKLANLHKLREQARTADRSATELDGFITQLAEFVTRDPKEALAATSQESADVIRLMTIHQAKGLEFPLVVIADLDRPPHPGRIEAALDLKLGPLVAQPADDDEPRVTTGMTLYKALEKIAEREERRRLLYVATTRAADYLILSSSLEGLDNPKSDWMQLVAARFDLESGQLTGALPAGYDAPLVRVTSAEPATDFKPLGAERGPDLINLLTEAHELAASGRGVVPREVMPIAVDRAARTQFSFSRLTGQIVRAEMPRSLPTTDDEHDPAAAIDPRGLGSLVHDVLERIDFRATSPDDQIRDWCEQLAPEHVHFNAAAAAREAEQMIERFFASPRGRHLAMAKHVHREVEFLLAWPPDGVGATGSASALSASLPIRRYLQGYIDCLYQDAHGDWHMLDYKTNDIPAAAVPHVAKQYELQLYVYAMAIERAIGTSPRELALLFLRPGREHALAWNDAARRRATKMVNEAIAASLDLPDPALPSINGLVTSVSTS